NRPRARAGDPSGRLRADKSPLPGRRRDLSAVARHLPEDDGRGGHPRVSDRGHGAGRARRCGASGAHAGRASSRFVIDLPAQPQRIRRTTFEKDGSMNGTVVRRRAAIVALLSVCLGFWLAGAAPAAAQAGDVPHMAGEASLVLPDLRQVQFLGGIDGHTLLLSGIGISVLGLLFGLGIYAQLRNMPVHPSMREVSELIWETCKTYLIQQGRFLL